MSLEPSAAMIFAAGFGTRMGALTQDIPKPMLSLNGRPMIDHAVEIVRKAGIQKIVVNTHYLHERIAPHIADLGVASIHEWPEILETGGALKAALTMLGDGPVVTLNPDAAWTGENPICELLDRWQPTMRALLMLVPLSSAVTDRNSGDFSLEQGEIHRHGDFIYSGAQIIRTDELAKIAESSFSLNLYWDLLAQSGPLHGLVHNGKWCDIGHPEGLARAERMLNDV